MPIFSPPEKLIDDYCHKVQVLRVHVDVWATPYVREHSHVLVCLLDSCGDVKIVF